mmetsp:Transcript_53866/g.166924  ORF Transcript_53866/g.166924 Transcript_53866/m.166924 type:complete len:325 (+) Transcript_53866:76-1050(+)
MSTISSSAHAAVASLGSHVGGHASFHGPLLMGVVYGLVHTISPDHLGTVMTLSSVTSPVRAFRVGASWGLGHSFGMVFLAAIFLCLRSLVTVDMDRWEHYGNYLIGVSMMAVAAYFISSESSFLKEEADGSVTATGCACHGMPDVEALATRPFARASHVCATHGRHYGAASDVLMVCGPCTPPKEAPAGSMLSEASAEKEVPAETPSWCKRVWVERDLQGALLGICQGLCCPLGVLGLGFLANLDAFGTCAFLIVFMLVSSFGIAILAAAWAALTSYGLGAKVSPRVVYRGSCTLTFALGLAWVTANFFNGIGALDYTESLGAH